MNKAKIENLDRTFEDGDFVDRRPDVSTPEEPTPQLPVLVEPNEENLPAIADEFSVVVQTCATVSVQPGFEGDCQLLQENAYKLYKAFNPRDAVESVIARLAVGLTNRAMASMSRAALAEESPHACELEMRSAIRATSAVTELLKLWDQRGRATIVTVGQVNVQSGGQAIVGHVGPRQRSGPSGASDED